MSRLSTWATLAKTFLVSIIAAAGICGPAISTASAQTTGVWRLVATTSDPDKKSGSTPQIYEKRDLGGYDRWTLATGSSTREFRQYNADPQHSLARDWKFQFTYDAPPSVIRPGDVFDLKIDGKTSGSMLDGSYAAYARFEGPGIKSVQLIFDGRNEDLSIGGLILGSQGSRPTPNMQAKGVFRFTAGADLPNEFTIAQVASGFGTVAVFKYLKDTSGQPASPGAAGGRTGPFEVYGLACDGDPARSGRRGRLVCVARVRNTPTDDPSTYEWTIDGRTVSGNAQIFFDGLAPGAHGVRVIAINGGLRSQGMSLNATVDGPAFPGGRPGVLVDPSAGSSTPAPQTGTPPPPVQPPPPRGGTAPPTNPPATGGAAGPPVTPSVIGGKPPGADDVVWLNDKGQQIRFTPGHPKYTLAARCNAFRYALELEALVNDGQVPTMRVVLSALVRCSEVLNATAPRSSVGSAARSATRALDTINIGLSDGAFRIVVSEPAPDVRVATPVALVSSTGAATFEVSYTLATDELRVQAISGTVDLLRAGATEAVRLIPGRPVTLSGKSIR